MEAFVQQVLSTFAEEWQQAAKERLAGRNIRASDELLQSVSAKALPGMVQALFEDQGRYHDMGAGRGYHKGKFMGTEERAEFLKGRTPSQWYSRLTWGKVYGAGGLVDLLSNAYVREVPGQLVQEFKQGSAT